MSSFILFGGFVLANKAQRNGWDSNPRGSGYPGGLVNRCFRPLSHRSLFGDLALANTAPGRALYLANFCS